MKVLWAPWRMDYILGEDKTPGCIFCPAPGESLAERLVLFNGNLTRIMMNKYPYINGHLLVSPRRHTPGLDDLTPAEMLDLLGKVRDAMAILKRVMHPDGFNVGLNLGRSAGAGLPGHLHWHIVPRWNGDTNFMPVLAKTSVVPEVLLETAAKLREELEKAKGPLDES